MLFFFVILRFHLLSFQSGHGQEKSQDASKSGCLKVREPHHPHSAIVDKALQVLIIGSIDTAVVVTFSSYARILAFDTSGAH